MIKNKKKGGKSKMKYQSNGQPVATSYEDLLEKLGYKTYKPRMGNLGRALLEASKKNI